MRVFNLRMPSPSMAISVTALVVAIGGTGFAAGWLISTQAGSVINGHLIATKNTPSVLLNTGPYSGPSFLQNNTIDFEAPSGANAIISGVVGTKSLGTDCWANFAGVK